MIYLSNMAQYAMQFIYWTMLAVLCKWLYSDTARNKYASTKGKVIGVVGAVLCLIAFDSCVSAALSFVRAVFGDSPEMYDPGVYERVYRAGGFAHLQVPIAIAMLTGGAGLLYWGVYSWRFTLPEMKDVRVADREQAKEDADAKNSFEPVGEVVSIRITVAKGGLLSSTERFTEIETSQGVLVVDGEVGTIAKGIPVYRNGWGKVRVGAPGTRTFDLRHA